MRTASRFIASLAVLGACLLAGAQTTSSTASIQQPANGPGNVAGLLYAANFAHWTVSPTPEGNRWSNAGQCYGTSGGIVFPLFATTAPIQIVDLANSSNTETVTPTLASYSGSGCSVALPATHAHTNYYLQSGTFGLQEALNYAGSGYYEVVLTPDWTTLGGTTTLATAATKGTNTTILDQRLLFTSYGVPTQNCAIGSIDLNAAATSTSTVLYVCYPANTWAAVSQP
jgi:hypothetical protein